MITALITTYQVTCEAAPVQVEGTLATGEKFYFRSRHRTVTLGVGATVHAAAEDPRTVALHVEGWDDDRHPLSYLDDPMPLVRMMIRMRARMIEYADRPGPALTGGPQ